MGLVDTLVARTLPAQKAVVGPGARTWDYGVPLGTTDTSSRRDVRSQRTFIREAIGVYHTDRHIKRAEQVIAARVGGVGWHLEDEDANEVTDESPPEQLAVRDLLEKPTGGQRVGNQPATRRELWTVTVRHAGLVNCAFWYLDEIDRFAGWPKQLLYIRPDRMSPGLDDNGELRYWALDVSSSGKGTRLELEEVLVYYVEPPDEGFYGHGLVEAAMELYRKTRLGDRHEIDVLAGGGRLAGILSPKSDVSDGNVFDRLQTDLRNVVDMPDAAKRTIVARAPIDFVPTAADLQKLQTEELGRLTREEKFGLWGVNPTLAGFPAPTGLSSGDSRQFDEAATWQNACQPRADMLAETIQFQLLDRLVPLGLSLQLKLHAPTFDDDTPKYEMAEKAKDQPLTQKERREILGLPPFDDERDDEVWIGDKRIYPEPAPTGSEQLATVRALAQGNDLVRLSDEELDALLDNQAYANAAPLDLEDDE